MKAAIPVGALALGMSLMLGCSPNGTSDPPATTKHSALVPDWGSIGSLSRQRQGQTTTLLASGEILIAGGDSNLGPTRTAELFVPETAEFIAVGDMGAERAYHTAIPLRDGRALIAGGEDGTGTLNSAELFDPKSRTFVPAPSLAQPRKGQTATTLDSGRVLIAGGGSVTTEIFDPAAGSFAVGPSMSESRRGHTATRLLDGRILFIGGGVVPNKAAEIFDPAAAAGQGAFTATGSLVALEPRLHTATLLSDGRVLVVGGCRVADPCNCASVGGPATCLSTQAAEIFIPTMNGGLGGFTTVASPTLEMRQGHTASLLPSGEVLLVGGGPAGAKEVAPPQLSKTAELFNPNTKAFSAAGSLASSRGGHTATVLPSGGVLIAGGAEPSLLDERVEFLTNPGAFASVSPMTVGRFDASATLLRSGRVLVAGGKGFDASSAEVVHSSSEQYDPSANVFVAGATMSTPRAEHSATPMPDGSVLLLGGRDHTNATLASAERFVPGAGSGSFINAGSLSVPRRRHAATLLPDRSVLVTGGWSGSKDLDSAEIYTASGAFLSLTQPMTIARSSHAAVLLRTGKVLLVGGSSAELYDPIAQNFAPTGAMIGVHQGPRLALLPDGHVLVAGQAAVVAEIYDPTTGTFSATSTLVEPNVINRSAHLLPTGSVLFAGGFKFLGVIDVATNVAEVFVPNANQGKGHFVRTEDMPGIHRNHASTLLADGRALLLGGFPCGAICAPVALSTATVYSDPVEIARRPNLSTFPPTLVGGTAATITGSGFAPPLDASHGGTASSPSNQPTVVWMPESGQGRASGPVTAYTDTSLSWLVPATALHGHGRVFVIVNGVASVGYPLELVPGGLGASCGSTTACTSGFCADGVCCDAACAGACRACTAKRKGSGQDGVCGDIPPELDATDSCPLSGGDPCTSAIHCGSSICKDGVCCDKPCTGQCEACDEPNALGQCIAVTGNPRGNRIACAAGAAGNPCAAQTCDGLQTDQCDGLVGAEVECVPASCSAGVALLSATCDGQGACSTQQSVSCAPASCDGTSCGAGSCRDDTDCHPDYRCSKGVGAEFGECVLANATECDGDHTLTSADGNTQDCAPYRCTPAGACITQCTSSLECVQGRACSAGGTCVTASAATDPTTGCGCRAVRNQPDGRGFWMLFLTLALGMRRRASRRRRCAALSPPLRRQRARRHHR